MADGTAASGSSDLVEREFTRDSVASLRERVEQLKAENELLKKQREKSEKDTHEFVAYFQKELEKKDDLIAKLNDQLLKMELVHKREREDIGIQHDNALRALRQEHQAAMTQLKTRLKVAEDDLMVLTEFRDMKKIVEVKLSDANQRIETQGVRHREQVQALERKFLEEKARLQAGHEEAMAEVRRRARIEAQKGLDADARKMLADNMRMVRGCSTPSWLARAP